MENLAERLARLSPEKRALILNQLAQREQSGSVRQAEQEIVTGPVPLLPAQQKLLDMMATYRLNYHHYNMCIMLEIARPLNIELAKQAIQHLMLHHDALRLRVRRDETGWRQWIELPGEDVPLTIQDFSTLPVAEQKQAIEAAANQWQTSLNLTTGPVLRIVYFTLGSQRPGRLLFIVHHMASDAYSLRLLLEDFFTAYQQRVEGKPIQLPAKTSSIQQRAERMLAYARSSEIRNELDYWFSLPWQEAVPLPMDFPQEIAARPRPQELKIVWSVEETQALLRSIQYTRNIQPRDVVLTALASVLARWNGSRTHIFAMHHHGRTMPFDDLDFSHTVGWLSVHPNVVVRLPESEDLEDCIVAVSEQMKRMPNAGAGFELLRHATDDPALPKAFNALPGPNIVFNYLGQRRTSTLFRQAQEAVGVQICLPNLWKSDLQMIFAEIVDNQLRFQWEYSETIYRRSTIEQIAAQLLETLRSLTR
jgi:non-ribosomal peptide synthase protein (TIGR01720 family)